MKRIIIPGPPGTGKTYHLTNHYLRKELEEYKTPSNKIAYITFSNAAADEAKKRIGAMFPKFDIKKDFPYVSTMHTLGTRQLNIDTSTQLLKDDKWNSFKNFSQICKDMSFESYISDSGVPQYKNQHMKIIEYARAKNISIDEAAIQLDLHHFVDVWLTEQIDADLKTYKEQTGMVEFSDMIKQFIEKDKCPPLNAVFLDEAQDLNPLQWDMFFYIESKCERSFIAGDDDQTIYTFQGASEDIFMGNDGATVGSEEAKSIYKYLNVKDKLVKYGYGTGKSLDAVDYVDIDDLMLDHGLLVSGSWEHLNIEEQSKLYIKSLLDNGDDLFKPARIKVSTIHGVKGEECDNVVLFTDLEKVIYDSALKNSDPEHRLFFVGVTRTKENLYIMQPTEEFHYNIGDPIL
jgi:superfamily I DNA/RNA helicase